MTRHLRFADLFCGAGGTTAGAEESGAARGQFAVNHWDVAVATHRANFPHVRHVHSALDQVKPGECPAIDMLFASPECTYFSRARGARPVNDQQREGAWGILPWIEFHRPAFVIVENVKEFREWGPVGRDGRPLRKHRCQIFDAWVRAIEAHGYRVDFRVLNAADYGAATSRERLFVVARKGSRRPRWPEPTHCRRSGDELPGLSLPRWRAAAEIIDWAIPCPSIFSRKRPLADKTLQRIEAGLHRFVGPFVTILRNNADAGSPGEPLRTICTGGAHHGLAVPFVCQFDNHGGNGHYVRDTDRPLATFTSKGNMGIAVPYLVPYLGERAGQEPRTHDPAEPMPTVTTENGKGLAVPFLLDTNHGDARHSGGRTAPVEQPLGTLTGSNGRALALPFFVHYYGAENISPVSDPLDTVTTRDRHGLVTARLLETMRELQVVDIGFRMLTNPELARAQGFGPAYVFHGTKKDVTKQIGNSVAPDVARHLTLACAAA